MDYLNNPERAQILTLAHEASTPEETKQAIVELRRWVQDHPQDLGIRDAFEPLSHLEDYLSTAHVQEPVASSHG